MKHTLPLPETNSHIPLKKMGKGSTLLSANKNSGPWKTPPFFLGLEERSELGRWSRCTTDTCGIEIDATWQPLMKMSDEKRRDMMFVYIYIYDIWFVFVIF